MMRSGIITLTTDFGLTDPYVGAMKGVLLFINPHANIIDITHHITPGGIDAAARILQETYPFFPEGTIHLGVVDPGVGTSRRPIVGRARGHFFVGPDNGLFWPILSEEEEAVMLQLTNDRYFRPHISRTFHGRDIFAPVAAHLSLGVDPFCMGEVIPDPVALTPRPPHQQGHRLTGRITSIDRFGNLITNITEHDLTQFLGSHRPRIQLRDLVLQDLCRQYADVPPGEFLTLFGSSGHLEIAVNQGRAEERLGIREKTGQGLDVVVERI